MSMALALTTLRSTFQQFFGDVAGDGQSVELSLILEKTLSHGIGAYVGSHDDPPGEITAIRIDTAALVRVEAANADIANLVQGVTSAVMGVERTELQRSGIFQLKMRELEPVQEQVNNRSSRVINFSLLYEYLIQPTVSEVQISEVILDIDLNIANGDAEVIINTGFDSSWEDNFEVIDDPGAMQNTPSNWQFDGGADALHQSSSIRGGSFNLTPRKSGTYLLLRTSADIPPVKDFLVDVDFNSIDNNGVGFVFRYQDIDNFYFCLLSAKRNYAMLGKKISGSFGFIDQGGRADVTPYQISTTHRLKLVALGNQFHVYVDDNVLVSGIDEAIAESGRVGLMCHGNNNVFFHRLQLLKLLSG